MKKQTVMVVEDEPDVAEVAKEVLEADGFEVLTAYDGLSALDQIPKVKPDLVLLDVMLPTVDGFELCKTIKDNPETREILVVLFTAATEPFLMERIVGVGANDYLTKPVNSDKLVQKVRSLLELAGEHRRRRSRHG